MATMKHARLLCVLALFACTGSDSTGAKSTGGTLTISTGMRSARDNATAVLPLAVGPSRKTAFTDPA